MSCDNWQCTGTCQSSNTNFTCISGCADDACLGWCGNGCLDKCDDGSGSGAGSGCTGCGDNGCTQGCKGDCGGCNIGCTSEEAGSLKIALQQGLNKKIYAADMQNINRMIEIQASSTRFNKTITSLDFKEKTKAQSSWVKQLQENLKKIEQTPKEKADSKVKTWEKTGKELIDLTIAAYDTTIKSDSTGE